MKLKRLFSGCVIVGLIVSTGIAEEVMWGFTPDRNLVSDAKNLPMNWNVETGEISPGKQISVRSPTPVPSGLVGKYSWVQITRLSAIPKLRVTRA